MFVVKAGVGTVFVAKVQEYPSYQLPIFSCEWLHSSIHSYSKQVPNTYITASVLRDERVKHVLAPSCRSIYNLVRH